MRFPLMLAAVLLPWTVLHAAKEKVLTAAQILDEVVTRPGDFDQMCDPPPAVPYAAPPIPAFGLSVPQTLFPSDEMKALLQQHRVEIVRELQSRLEKLDWLHPPTAPPIPKKPLFVKKEPGNPEFDPTEPSGQNPRALGGIMLSIIGDLDAVELLPQLLKLEDSLHQITQAALKDGKAPVPIIPIGGGAMWQGMMEEEAKLADNEKVPPAFQRKEDLFHALVFDRQLLGVMLQLLQRKNYAPLKDSTPGLLHTLALKHKPFDEEMAKIKRPEDIPENERRYIFFDKDLGIPYWQHEHAEVIYSERMRNEVRGLAQAFVSGTPPPAITGQDIVEEALRKPGNFDQMCGSLPVAFNLVELSVPAYGWLFSRYYSLDSQNLQIMQAHRAKVVPVLNEKLHDLDLSHSPSKDRHAPPPYSLLLEFVTAVHGIEALPELLRLEALLHESLAAAKGAGALPQVNMDAIADVPKGQDAAVFNARLFQLEILGVIGKLLHDEDYEPYFSSALEKERAAGLRKTAAEGELKDIKTELDIPYDSREFIHWDKRLGIPFSDMSALVKVPYTDALRDEVRRVAEDFLKNVPPDKRKGEAAMKLIGMPR